MRHYSEDPDCEEPTVAARKRRMEARNKIFRQEADYNDLSSKRHKALQDGVESVVSSCSSSEISVRGVKKHARYEPELPDEELAHWSKEELSEWRKVARKVRNRESAAASRRKTRERISELEQQVEELKSKYQDALKRIHVLAAQAHIEVPKNGMPIITPPSSVAPPSPEHTSTNTAVVSPPLSPHQSLSLMNPLEELYLEAAYQQPQHIISISRPTAVSAKITGAEIIDTSSTDGSTNSSATSTIASTTPDLAIQTWPSSDMSDVTEELEEDSELVEFLWQAFANEDTPSTSSSGASDETHDGTTTRDDEDSQETSDGSDLAEYAAELHHDYDAILPNAMMLDADPELDALCW